MGFEDATVVDERGELEAGGQPLSGGNRDRLFGGDPVVAGQVV
jgi:hypothetical protein